MMKYLKKINGDRLYLSPINIEDIDKYIEWMNDKNITDKIHSTHKIINIENEKEWINNVLLNGEYVFGILKKDGDILIGNCSIMNLNLIDRTATLGIFIGDQENQHQGYGQETLKLLLNYGFNILNLNNINLGVFDFNENAIKCYKSVGFKEYGRRHECYYLDGKYHDEIFMEVLKKDYQK